MGAKKPVVIIVILAIIFIILLMVIGTTSFFGFKLFSIVDTETQLKSEYVTYWASSTDSFEGNFDFSGNVNEFQEEIEIGKIKGREAKLTTTRNFFGQEVVILFSSFNSKINGVGFSDSIEDILILKPKTFEPQKVDLIHNGVFLQTITVPNPFFIEFLSPPSGTTSSDTAFLMQVFFIGYKAEFACDLAPDEVWIEESFAQQFDITDLSFPVTKFCDASRPFVLRNIAEGETKISFAEGILPLNRGELIPSRALQSGEIVTVSYATPNVVGVTNKCDPDQANIKVAGIWVCTQVIETTTITRIIPEREIIPITSINSFIFSTTDLRKEFDIGTDTFAASQRFICDFPAEDDVIRPPNPSSDCYKSDITFAGKQITFNDGQTQDIDPNIEVQYFAGGELTRTVDKLTGIYIFSLGKTIELDVEGGLKITHKEGGLLPITLINHLPKNDILIKVQQTAKQADNLNLPEKTETFTAFKGTNQFIINIDTDNLGLNEITIQAFYPITADSEILLPSDRIKVGVDVFKDDSIIEFVEVDEVEDVKQPSAFKRFINSIITFFKNIFN